MYVDQNPTAPILNPVGLSWSQAVPELADIPSVIAQNGYPGPYIIYVAEGFYLPTGPGGPLDESLSFELNGGDAIYGGFLGYEPGNPLANEGSPHDRNGSFDLTILSGNITNDPTGIHPGNSDNVVTITGTTNDPAVLTTLDGVTVENGYANTVVGLSQDRNRGGGILIGDDSGSGARYVRLKNVTVRNCYANDAGGGVAIERASDVQISFCSFEDNNCFRVQSNGIAEGNGGAIYFGTSADAGGQVSVFNCRLTGNRAAFGGFYLKSILAGDVNFVNTLIDRNTAYAGGGAFVANDSPDKQTPNALRIAHTTIADNDAVATTAIPYREGGGLHVADLGSNDNVQVIVMSSIIQRNRAFVNRIGSPHPDVAGSAISDVQARYSNIKPDIAAPIGGANVLPGPGNINAAPLFQNPSMGDYHLQASSPCVDSGDDSPLLPLGTSAFAIGDLCDIDDDNNRNEPYPFEFDGSIAREINIFSAPNTGLDLSSLGAISDMGCHEREINPTNP